MSEISMKSRRVRPKSIACNTCGCGVDIKRAEASKAQTGRVMCFLCQREYNRRRDF